MNSPARSRIQQNLIDIRGRISAACARVGRDPNSVKLVAVCKNQPLEFVQAYIDICIAEGKAAILAQNYLQPFLKLKDSLSGGYEAHMIGPLQRNKAKDAVKVFDVIESMHSERLAVELNKAALATTKRQKVFLQINISDDSQKSGFTLEQAYKFAKDKLPGLEALDCSGVMTITRLYDDPKEARPDFAALREAAKSILRIPEAALSMGMSGDYEIAIEEGATHVRIGTALFGERAL